jgi:hypothetical protein
MVLITKVILDSCMSGPEEKDEIFVAPAHVENQNKILDTVIFFDNHE